MALLFKEKQTNFLILWRPYMSDKEKEHQEEKLKAEQDKNVPEERETTLNNEDNKSVRVEYARRMADRHDEFVQEDISHPADIADHLSELATDEQVYLLSTLPAEDAAEALVEMDEHTQTNILQSMNPDIAAGLLGEMSPDDAADVLEEMNESQADTLLEKLDSDDAEEIRQLMAFDSDTAGGIMNTEILILDQNLTADQAIHYLRSEIGDKEIPYYAYVVSRGDYLEGVLSLRDLLLLQPGIRLKDAVGDQNLITTTFDSKREEVALLISRYNFMALPIVDYDGRLLGVVSHDDIIDVIQDLASEDMLGMVGAGQDESIDTPWQDSVKMRLPWLLINMLNSILSASVVYLYNSTIEQMAILAVFMPMVGNQAGNTGQQALAVIIRQMAVDRIEGKRARKAILRELLVCFINGLLICTLSFIGVSLFTDSVALGLIMSSALLMDMILGALAGACIPLILRKIGRDPAQASSIFLTAITDGAGFFIFLSMATVFLL